MTPITLAPGQMIDDFLLGERIAVGGMGSIWRVSHPDWTEPLVLKTPFLGAGADVSTIVGYEAEEMILRRLEGPHVPRFVAAGDLRKRPYLVMEFVAGEVLEAKVEAGRLPLEDVVRIGARLALAVDNLHRQGVLHLDLKPGNIIIAERGVVLIDYGLARHQDLPDLLAEESNRPMGSPATIAPEQLVGDRSRPESDVFAIGSILYRMLTGVYPFGEPPSVPGQKRRLYRLPKPPRALNRDVPRWMQELILRCLEVDPALRYPSAGQLLFDLNHPDQIRLTERAERRPDAGFWQRIRAWATGRDLKERKPSRVSTSRRLASAPIILATVDLAQGSDPLTQEVRHHVTRLLVEEPGARLACLTIRKTRLVGDDPGHDSSGRTSYVSRLVALKDWARSFDLPEDRVSYHVVEAFDVAAAILDYIRLNQVDHVVMGARSAGAIRRHLGSVSSAVVAEAPCTVTVVRLKAPDEAAVS